VTAELDVFSSRTSREAERSVPLVRLAFFAAHMALAIAL